MESTNEKGESFEVPVKGSLGLLAVGYKGIMLWRMKKMGLDGPDIKIIPPIVFGKVLRLAHKKPAQPIKKEDE